jgi:hypothetical protein
MARLLPRQTVRGHSASQIGKVGGNVTIVHLTQHLPGSAAQTVQPTRPAGIANDEQRHVLQLIRQLANSNSVLDFMQREFGTRVVVNLQPAQLYRVRRYVEVIIKSEKNRVAHGD